MPAKCTGHKERYCFLICLPDDIATTIIIIIIIIIIGKYLPLPPRNPLSILTPYPKIPKMCAVLFVNSLSFR